MASRLCALKIFVLKSSMSIPVSIPKSAPEKKKRNTTETGGA
jgi:hypothetical protein